MTGIHRSSSLNRSWGGALVLVVGLLMGCAQQEQAPQQARGNKPVEAQPKEVSSVTATPNPAVVDAESKPKSAEPKSAKDSGSDLDHFEPAVAAQLRAARADVLATPNGVAKIGRLAILYHIYGMMSDAQVTYARASELAPDVFRWHYLRGHVLLALGMNEQAVVCFRKAADLKPDYLPAKLMLANAYTRMRNYRKALEVVVPLYDADSENPLLSYTLGINYLGAGKAVWAVQYLKPVLDGNPRYGGVREALATAFHNLGQEAKALSLREGWSEDKSVPAMQDPELMKIYRQATGSAAERRMGIAYLSRGDFVRAVEHFKKALKFAPDSEVTRLALSDALIGQGDFEAAASALHKILARSENNRDALVRLASLYFAQGKIDAARPIVERVARQEPVGAAVLAMQAKLAVLDGNIDTAVDLFERSVKLDADNATAHYELAQIYYLAGRAKDSEQSLRRVLEIDPEHHAAEKGLGDLYWEQGEVDTALTWYRRALDGGARFPSTILARVVAATLKKQEFDRGVMYLQQGLEDFPDSAELLDMQSRVFSMCPDDAYRNGKETLKLSIPLYGTNPDKMSTRGLATTAAAWAELDNFQKATEILQRGMELAKKREDNDTFNLLGRQLLRYKDGLRLYDSAKPSPRGAQ